MLEPLFGTPFSTDQAKEFNWSFCSMKIKQTTPIYEKELYLSLAIYYEWSFISLKCFQPTARATTRRVWRLVFESDGFFGLNCIGKQELSCNNDCQKHSEPNKRNIGFISKVDYYLVHQLLFALITSPL